MTLRSLLVGALSFLLGCFAGARPLALVLIPHEAAGPNLPTPDFIHAEWIRWPANEGYARMLALATGTDFRGEPGDGKFALRNGARIASNGRWLAARGVFDTRRRHLDGLPVVAVENASGGVSPNVLLLALDGPNASVVPQIFGAALPEVGLVVYEAGRWDEVDAVSKQAERTLVIEYPPNADEGWGRFWLKGAWPEGVPGEGRVSGLIPARRAMRLLLVPQEFGWRSNDAGVWGGANRWLLHGALVSPALLVAWFVLAALIVAWGLAQVMNEDRGPFVSELLVLVALSPAAIVLGGTFARFGGLEAWPIWLTVAGIALYLATSVASFAVRHYATMAHPLWGASLFGLATLTTFDPLWSDLSGIFVGREVAVPGAALGAWTAYLVGAVAFGPGRGFGRALVAAFLLLGITANPWWIGGHSALLILPALALLAAEGLFRPSMLIMLALLPTGVVKIVRDGVVWNPENLRLFANDAHAQNLWESAVGIFSPGWGGTVAFFGVVLLLGTRFLAYRTGRLLRNEPALRAFLWIGGATLALGVVEPLVLPAIPVLAFGSAVVLAYDGLRANG